MKRKRISFSKLYLIYVMLLSVGIITCVSYVGELLQQYECLRPELHVEAAIKQLQADASQDDFWSKYGMPEVEAGKYEKNLDLKGDYLAMYADESVGFSKKNGTQAEDELIYAIKSGDVELAEVKLKAKGPSVTKLAVLNYREWETEYIKPVMEKSEYTISVPDDFHVSANGVALEPVDGVAGKDGEITYVVHDVYCEPEFAITDKDGNMVSYTVNNYQVDAEFYHYNLTLPATLMVKVNGKTQEGEPAENNCKRYDIRLLEKPEITISDYYGNEVCYEGGNQLPLTYMTVKANSKYAVEIADEAVPTAAVCEYDNPEYSMLAELVEDLPKVQEYDIAVLEEDVQVSVTDEAGVQVVLDQEKAVHDFTVDISGLRTVPEEVSCEVDVLALAQEWSLFMSKDASFASLSKHLLAGSNQYRVARQYATGADIHFTSEHTLMNPAFTDTSVTNFIWITENCFSVDISFVKHMLLRKTGQRVDDPMNDRFYFVKSDETKDGIDNPTWKIAGMKEIVNDAE